MNKQPYALGTRITGLILTVLNPIIIFTTYLLILSGTLLNSGLSPSSTVTDFMFLMTLGIYIVLFCMASAVPFILFGIAQFKGRRKTMEIICVCIACSIFLILDLIWIVVGRFFVLNFGLSLSLGIGIGAVYVLACILEIVFIVKMFNAKQFY